MLKLPPLGGSASLYNPFHPPGGKYYSRGGILGGDETCLELKTLTWQNQAQEKITSDMASTDKYKSVALHAEVKLAESLEKCRPSSRGEDKPNKMRTAVSCHLLGEFAELCGPLSSVLKNIRDELIKAIYSDLYISEQGQLEFSQQTWFAVAEKLEQEKALLLEEREGFRRQIQEQEEMFARIEESMRSYQQAMTDSQLEAAASKSRLESGLAAHQAAITELKTGRDELKKSRKEWLQMREELDAERLAHSNLMAIHDYSISDYKGQVGDRDLTIEALKKDLQDYVPISTLDASRMQLTAARQQVSELQQFILGLQSKIEALTTTIGTMTPRPTWNEFESHVPGIGNFSTTSPETTEGRLHRVAQRLTELTCSDQEARSLVEAKEAELLLMDSLLFPDPIPGLIQLSLVTDSSEYFITEREGGSGGSDNLPTVRVEGLGLSAQTVPRCLRWKEGDLLSIETWTLSEAEAEAEAIWRAKVKGGKHSHLTSFLYEHFSSQVREKKEVEASGHPLVTLSRTEIHRQVVCRAYSLFHTCSLYSRESSKIRLLGAVLTGQLPMGAKSSLDLMKRSLFDVLVGKSGSDAFVPGSDAMDSLVTFYPMRDAWSLHKLKEAFRSAFLVGSDKASLASLMTALVPSQQHSGEEEAVISDGEEAFINRLDEQYLDDLENFATNVVAVLSSSALAALGHEAPAARDQDITGAKDQDITLTKEAKLIEAGMSKTLAREALIQFQTSESLRAFYLLTPSSHFYDEGEAVKKDQHQLPAPCTDEIGAIPEKQMTDRDETPPDETGLLFQGKNHTQN